MTIDPIDTKRIDSLLAGYKKPEDIIGKHIKNAAPTTPARRRERLVSLTMLLR